MMHMKEELVETTTATMATMATMRTQEMNQEQKLDLHITTMNLVYDNLEDERNFHAGKARDQNEIFDSLSEGSPAGQVIVEKSIQYAELKQENDNLQYKLEEADRKHKLMEEERAALYDMVQSLQQELDGGAMDEEHQTTIENGDIIMTSESRTQDKSIKSERDEYKKKGERFQRERDGLVEKGREREVRHNLSLRSMKSMIDQVEGTNELLSQKCKTLNQVIQELEDEKALQLDKIEALETQFQEFNTARLERASRVTERGACYDDTTCKKISGDDDDFRVGSTADIICLGPPQQEAKEGEDQIDSPSTRSKAHTTQSEHLNKLQQDEDDTVTNSSEDQAEEPNEQLSQKCETLTKVIQELEDEKALQLDKIEALETQFQEFKTNRGLGRSSRVTERGAYYEYINSLKKRSDDDGFPGGSTADICPGPQQAPHEEEDQTIKPSTRSRAHTTQYKHIYKHQQDEDEDMVANFFYVDPRKKM